MLSKIKSFLKARGLVGWISIITILIGGGFALAAIFNGGLASLLGASNGEEQAQTEKLFQVQLEPVASFREGAGKLSLTGEVQSLDQVELTSQVSAKVTRVNAQIGDRVFAGQTLVFLDSSDLQGSLLQAQANLDAQLVALRELEKGARPEQTQIARTQVQNAENSLALAKTSLDSVKSKAEIDLGNAYNSALASLKGAANTGKKAILSLTEIQQTHFRANDQESLIIKNAKENAVLVFLGERHTTDWSAYSLSVLAGGVYGDIQTIQSANERAAIEQALNKTLEGLNLIRTALQAVPSSSVLTASEQAVLAAEKSAIDGQIAAITGAKSGLSGQKAANENIIKGAEQQVAGAESALKSAKDQLALATAGATQEQLDSQLARIKSARGSLVQIQAQIGKTVITTPISGQVASLPVRLGELVNPGMLVASIVNTDGLKIITHVDAQNIEYVKAGDKVIIEKTIEGQVLRLAPSINPVTKKAEVQIAVSNPETGGLVVGRHVNLEIAIAKTGSDEILYLLPLTAVKSEAAGSAIFTVNAENRIEKIEVTLGRVIGDAVQVLSVLDDNLKIILNHRGLEEGQEVEIL